MNTGDPAPDFEATTSNGEEFRLSDHRDKNVVVLFFYPQDGTPVCTKEACAFRDFYEDFVSAGAVVVGISKNGEASHQRFAAKNRLPFPLISDTGNRLRKLFGVESSFAIFPGRATYVIDRQGIVRHQFNSQFQGEKHVDEALEMVRRLASEGPSQPAVS